MTTLHAEAEARIAAPAAEVYRYLADFRVHHPQYLPPAFSDLQVELGGYGAGTVITFKVTLWGVTRTVHSEVAEPAPGRVMTETDMATGAVTTFTVLPDGDACRVRIETDWRPSRGFNGLMERLFGAAMLRSLYRDELRRLDTYARAQTGAARPTPERAAAH